MMSMKSERLFCVLCWLTGCAILLAAAAPQIGNAQEALPEGLKVVSIEVFPPSIELKHRFEYRQLFVTGKLESGESADLTRLAKLGGSPAFVAVSPSGLVRPVADGEEKL